MLCGFSTGRKLMVNGKNEILNLKTMFNQSHTVEKSQLTKYLKNLIFYWFLELKPIFSCEKKNAQNF